MIVAIISGVVALIVIVWVRNTRRARHDWLAELDLPGIWDLDNSDIPECIEFSGSLASGRYVQKRDGEVAKGRWTISGGNLILHPDGEEFDPSTYELRRFRTGNIGIDGTDRPRQIFVKRSTNIIPLRRRR